jgi:hypothetical protein
LIALWFVVQIVVPFTAPLQTLDVRDWLGAGTHQSARTVPESSATPTITEGSAPGALAPMVERLVSIVWSISDADTIGHPSLASVRPGSRALSLQRSILRL